MNCYVIFLQILNMSLTASVIICVVLLCRLLLKRAPKIYSYALWSVVLFRLLCPVSLSAPVSVLSFFDTPVIEQMKDNRDINIIDTSSIEYISSDVIYTEYPAGKTPDPVVDEQDSAVINEMLSQAKEQLRANYLEASLKILTYLWLAGILVLLTYGIISYVKLRQRLLGALKIRDNIYMADHISGPFVIGLLRPTIYLPSDLKETEQVYIVLHEQHHIRRCDHLLKMLAFLALCIHWFNPLVWAAFRLAVKDMEMSCDEAILRKLGEKIRAEYSTSLLQLTTGHKILFGSPLAFGEREPAGRIRNLARFRRPRIVVTVAASLLCAVGLLVCIVNPATPEDLLRMTEKHSDVNGNRVKYEVEFGNKVGSAILYVEQWINGACTRTAQITLTKNVKSLQVLMKERNKDGILNGIDIQIDTEDVAGSLLTYFAFPEEHTTSGWVFKAYEENEKLKVVPGEEKILAVMMFDEGDGVRVFDCETLQNGPERIENAEHMILVKAVFNEEVVEESRVEEVEGEDEQGDAEQSVATEVKEENAEDKKQEINSDFQWSTEGLNVWMENFAPGLASNIFYVAALDRLENVGILPDGKKAYVSEGEAFENRVAFQDVDMDGQNELLLDIGGTCMADMGIYVYQYDENLDEQDNVLKFRRELVVWFEQTFYSNGIVIAKWSHNHGYSDTDIFWPYNVYGYNADTDEYFKLWTVDAWEKRLRDVDYDGIAFPDKVDIDKDGMIYRIRTEETDELTLLDSAEYTEWLEDLLKGAEEIQVQWKEIPR